MLLYTTYCQRIRLGSPVLLGELDRACRGAESPLSPRPVHGGLAGPAQLLLHANAAGQDFWA